MPETLEKHPRQLDLIRGRRVVPEDELDKWICNPSTGEPIQRQLSSGTKRVLEAIEVARQLDDRGTWREVPEPERARLLEAIADNLDERASLMAEMEALGTGVVISVTRMFADSLSGPFRDAAQRLRSGWSQTDLGEESRPVRLLRLPWGPTAVLIPWNAPAGVASKKIAYALAVGAPVILKANEWAPFGCNVLADAIDEAGLPDGVFQMVHGGAEVGHCLVSDPRIRAISFTGSVEVGRKIAQAASVNFTATQLELSGNNPVIVLQDADIEQTAEELCSGMIKLNGEWCEAPRKVFVPSDMQEPLMSAMRSRLARMRIGRHDDPDADIGPLVHEGHRVRLDDEIRRLQEIGAKVDVVGTVPELSGWFWAPRLVSDIEPGECIEEMFGPVITFHTYESESQALESANDSPYGLAAYVFGSDIDHAMEVGSDLRYGEVKVNGTSILDLSPKSVQSFWRCSGIGGHGDDDVFAFFSGSQIVGVDRPGLPI